MYHGTRPEYADAIERYGFVRSRRVLGEGVYLRATLPRPLTIHSTCPTTTRKTVLS